MQSLRYALNAGELNLEVTNTDVGSGTPNNLPLPNGFSVHTLMLSNGLDLLRLLDDSINQGGGTPEAIYVTNLYLGTSLTASNFDFGANNLKIYYANIIGDGGIDYIGIFNGPDRIVYLIISSPSITSLLPSQSRVLSF